MICSAALGHANVFFYFMHKETEAEMISFQDPI